MVIDICISLFALLLYSHAPIYDMISTKTKKGQGTKRKKENPTMMMMMVIKMIKNVPRMRKRAEKKSTYHDVPLT